MIEIPFRPFAALAVSVLLSVTACGGSSPAPADPDTTGTVIRPAAIQVVSGDVQTGVVGTELPAALVVRVVDASGAPVSGQVVNFTVLEGGGTTFAGTAVTGASGQAQERWTLGSTAGAQRLEARAVDGVTGAPIVFATFDATARPGAPTQVSVVSGSGQAATTGSLLPVALVAKVSDAHGNGVQGVSVTFAVTVGSGSVVPPSAATDSAGQATAAWALGPEVGQQKVEAQSSGLAPATFDATSTTPVVPVASVAVTVVTTDLTVGHSTLATAVVMDAAGHELTGRPVAWSSSAEVVAIVNASGDVTALSVGSATITATSEGKSGSVLVTTFPEPPAAVATVTAAVADGTIVVGQSTQASAVPRDEAGNVLDGRAVTWTSSAPAVASVDAAGRVTGASVGTTSIFATCEGLSGSVQVGVIVPPPAPVATVTASLASSALYVGQATQATAVLRDASGNLLAGRSVAWSTSNASVATVNAATGVVTATGVGTVGIIATSEGKTGSASMTVALVPVATVIATLGTSSVTVGQATQASAVLRDAAGNVLSGRTIAWTSSNPAVATVNAANGLVTGLAAGTASITATSEGQTGSTTLTVSGGVCVWTPVRTESLATTPAGAIPGGGLAGSQGPTAVGGRTAYASTSDWLALDIPTTLSPSDDVFSIDVDLWLDGIEKARTVGVMIFTDHAVGSSTPYWLNNYGEVHGLWAGLDHAAPPAWNVQWRLPPTPAPASGWGGGGVGTPAFTAATSAPAAGWHHVRIEGDRSRCAFDLEIDGVPGPSFQGACDPAGASLTLHHWIPPAGRTGSPVVAFSNLVISRGTGASCRPWTLAKQHDLTALPTGAIAKTGAMNGQGPAVVGGRTAWLQHSDWNVLEVPTGLTALDDEFAVEVDQYVPAAGTEKTSYLNVFGKDAGAPNQFTAGAQVFSTFLAPGTGRANWERRTPSGLVADPTTPLAFPRDAWHTVRVEGKRSTCRFAYLVDGAAVISSTLPGCDVTGAYFILVGGGTSGVPSDVAWSNLRVYRR